MCPSNWNSAFCSISLPTIGSLLSPKKSTDGVNSIVVSSESKYESPA
jgi:hypothetical protein